VSLDGQTAPTVTLLYGVPQGSVLGPPLFVLYTAHVCNIVASKGLSSHVYADDQQVYVYCRPSETQSAVDRFRARFFDIEE